MLNPVSASALTACLQYFRLPVLLFASLLVVLGCARHNYAPVEDIERPRQASSGVHVVRKGETLYSIAFRYGRNYRDLARANRIPYPYTIKPGQRISLAAQRAASPTPSRTVVQQKPVQKEARSATSSGAPNKWRWPLKGSIATYFAGTGNKGIDIEVKGESPVRAAADGVVVYAGDGLKGYGNLVIIKHNATYLSAYAHNSRLLVDEEKSVKAGQKIAEIASTDGKKAVLHFEIRRNGHPVNPLKYLPRG